MERAPCLRQRAALPQGLPCGRGASGRFEVAGRPVEVPVPDQAGPARQLPVRHVRGAARAGGARACVERHHGQADRGRLYREGYRYLGQRGGALDPRRRRPRRRPGPCQLWLRPVHGRPGCPLWRREGRLHGDPHVRRTDRETGAADPRVRAQHHHGDAVIHAEPDRGDGAPGHGSVGKLAQGGHLRRRAVDGCDARRNRGTCRHRRGGHLRPV
ncbi:hypothetical protein D3C72_1372150 [compost metagenome]